MAAGTITITEKAHIGTVRKIVFAWTAGTDADAGTASGTTTAAYDGELLGFTTDPDGVSVPTDNYDLELLDADSHDVLLGAGANRDSAVVEHVARASLAAVAGSKLTLSVTNAGAGGKGVAVVYIR